MRSGTSRFWVVATFVAVSSAVPARAVRQPEYMRGRPELEVASGPAVRAQRTIVWDGAPAQTEAPWARFRAMHGPRWRAMFDAGTGVPLRIYGEGIQAPGAVDDAATAARAARALLTDHIDLLAPGSAPADFVLAGNHLDRGMRTVGFVQTRGGLPVLGGQVSFRFKNDRLFVIGSEAIPGIEPRDPTAPTAKIGDAVAAAAAVAWLKSDTVAPGGDATVRGVHGPVLLPLVGRTQVLAVRKVLVVTVDVPRPIGRWDVYVDADSGAPIARTQTLRFATATIQYDVPDRYPQNGRRNAPAQKMNVTGAGAATTDGQGKATFPGAMATLGYGVVGPFIRVLNDAGAELTFSKNASDGATLTESQAMVEFGDAQLNAFIAAQEVKNRLLIITPNQPWLTQQQQVTVNINDTCNAFSDGDSINFFRAGGGCANTGRLSDVVQHETGHSIHANEIIQGAGEFDGALSEGISDYLAATIVNDAGMGRGFFNNNEALRDCNPPDGGPVWPQDQGEIHTTGIIICGALWDTRQNLVGALGEGPGVSHADQLWLAVIRRASDIPSSYPEVLAEDDDDGNIDNGTPNKCLIDDAFAQHGLAEPGTQVGPGVKLPELQGRHVKVPVTGSQNAACPGKDISKMELHWEYRHDAAQKGTVSLTKSGDAYEGDIPAAPDGTVVKYQVVTTFADSTTLSYPDNPADPMYEMFVGETTVIQCFDFEDASEPAGWTHALDSGTAGEGADDWQWGVPQGTSGSGDPKAAYSGQKVWGNDLGGGNYNGQYQADKVNHLESPEIDVSGYAHVRLQYRRWLNIEDGDFDQGTIYVDGVSKWTNRASGNPMAQSGISHTDKEWRFHDVELDAEAADGKVRITWELKSDGGVQMGGWTIDDVCIVAYAPATCGDGQVTGGEECDDGGENSDTTPDACRSDCTAAACGDGVKDSGEQCDDGNGVAGDGCSESCQAEPGTAVCGNGVVDDGEACDDGNRIDSGDACTNACTPGAGGAGDGDDGSGGCGCRAGNTGSRAPALGLALVVGLALAGLRLRLRRRRQK